MAGNHFHTSAGRIAAYRSALSAAIARQRSAGCEAHVLDLGAGCGALAIAAAAEGAASVVACEALEPLCRVARDNAARNGLSAAVSVVNCDVVHLQKGVNVRRGGANIAVFDLFDAGEWRRACCAKLVLCNAILPVDRFRYALLCISFIP